MKGDAPTNPTTLTYLRSIEVAQTSPFLAQAVQRLGHERVTCELYYTDGECSPADFPGRARRIPADITAAEICSLFDGTDDPPVVASLSIPDENAVRDAYVKAQLEAEGGRVVCCDARVAATFANKWETKSLLAAHGIPYPPAITVDGDLLNARGPRYVEYASVVRTRVAELGYPALVKPLWDCLGNGIVHLADEGDLAAYLSAPGPGNVIIERCVSGTLCSVEVLTCNGHAYVQPLTLKGPAGGPPSFAFSQVRHTRDLQADAAGRRLCEKLVQLCTSHGVEGAIELEFVDDGVEYVCIEVNPRISGSTGISIAASGVNTYDELGRMSVGPWTGPRPQQATQRSRALQFPVHPQRAMPELPPQVELHRMSTFSVPDRGQYRSALVSVPPGQDGSMRRWVDTARASTGVDDSTATELEALLR